MVILTAVLVLTSLGYSGETNLVAQAADTGKASEAWSWELTLGGAGTHVNNESLFGVDVSLSTNPFEFAPSLWVGLVQGAFWEPDFAGSTDVNLNWSWHLFGELYLNTGWSAGIQYSDVEADSDNGEFDVSFRGAWRTGPEATFQYYIGNAFIYSGVNYDIALDDYSENGWRYSFGIGLAF